MSIALLLAVIVATLYVWWRLMAFTFALIDHAHEKMRARDAELELEASSPPGERDGC